MTEAATIAAAQADDLVHFDVQDGRRRVRFDIADEALEALSGLSAPSTATLRRRSFDRFRTLIDAAAKLKLTRLAPGIVGPITLSTQDLRCVTPSAGMPRFGSVGRAA